MSTIKQIAKTLGGTISKNSPTILTGMAVAGLVSTTIMGIRATPKAMSLIDDAVFDKYEETVGENRDDISFADWMEQENGYDWKDRANTLSKKEVIKLCWKVYIPTALMAGVSIACIIGSNRISLRRNAALASLYGLTETAFKEYQAKVVETIGKNKEIKVRDEIAADHVKRNPAGKNEIIFTGKGEVICMDELSGRYFKSDIDKINKTINEMNYRLRHENFLSVNEFYDEIGLAHTSLGNDLGWGIDKGEIEVSFSAQLTDSNEPCIVLNYKVNPNFY